ncbi:uncharacterized protein LOC128663788 [Bombina bombina]|uniref:uncharacterized protein LOC128663788 n=1 Tax=Bombina bombina TaxID=8345 RepID=UPI00235AED62|nr:uncharacterized protein LOC128663788 [Bombina bombina]
MDFYNVMFGFLLEISFVLCSGSWNNLPNRVKMLQNIKTKVLPVLISEDDDSFPHEEDKLWLPYEALNGKNSIQVMEDADIFKEILKYQLRKYERKINLRILKIQGRSTRRIKKHSRKGATRKGIEHRTGQPKSSNSDRQLIPKNSKQLTDGSRSINISYNQMKRHLELQHKRKGHLFSKKVKQTIDWLRRIDHLVGSQRKRQLGFHHGRNEKVFLIKPTINGSGRTTNSSKNLKKRKLKIQNKWKLQPVPKTVKPTISRSERTNQTLDNQTLRHVRERANKGRDKNSNIAYPLFVNDQFLQSESSGNSEFLEVPPVKENGMPELTINNIGSAELQHIASRKKGEDVINILTVQTTTTQKLVGKTLLFTSCQMGTQTPRVTQSLPHKQFLGQDILNLPDAVKENISGSVECGLGYKEYSGTCRSLCDIDLSYCENGGQCLVVENLGATCRCPQTAYLCYKGECCSPPFTFLQLAFIIISCCILLSVPLVSILILLTDARVSNKSGQQKSRYWLIIIDQQLVNHKHFCS